LSASHEYEDGYAQMTGTSMAAPHVTGTIALLLSEKPDLNIAEIRDYLSKGAHKNVPSTGYDCGGISEKEFPNHAFGTGILNAYSTLSELLKNNRKTMN